MRGEWVDLLPAEGPEVAISHVPPPYAGTRDRPARSTASCPHSPVRSLPTELCAGNSAAPPLLVSACQPPTGTLCHCSAVRIACSRKGDAKSLRRLPAFREPTN